MKKLKRYLPSIEDCRDYTLFIDRDGVINQPIINDYARSPSDFKFCEGAQNALVQLKKIFGRVILLTNQQGIGKGIMTAQSLENVHLKMYNAIHTSGAYFDLVLYAPYLSNKNHSWRKPSIGMMKKAKQYFPEINYAKSIMVGDSPGDMALADQIGSIKVKISNHQFSFTNQDFTFDNLLQFVTSLSNK